VHRLVQAVVRGRLDQQDRQQWAGVAVRLVGAAFPADSNDVRAWPTCARLLPHVLAATDHAASLAAEPEVELTRFPGTPNSWQQGHPWEVRDAKQALPGGVPPGRG